MPVTHRFASWKQSANIQKQADGTTMSREALISKDSTSSVTERTTSYDESLRLMPWQTDNEYILTGFRMQLPSIKVCIWSAIGCEF